MNLLVSLVRAVVAVVLSTVKRLLLNLKKNRGTERNKGFGMAYL